MSRHQYDLVMCMKLPGTSVGKVCDRCDGRCPLCDSDVRLISKVRICDSCSSGSSGSRCIICGSPGTHEALYCWDCHRSERSRDGCPRILNVGSNKTDRLYNKKTTDTGKGV